MNLIATFTDPDSSDTHTAIIDWGDGTIEPGAVNELTGNITGSHVYADDDTYAVIVIVADDHGAFGEDSLTVTVHNVSPQITALNLDSATIDENGTVALSGSFTDSGLLDTHAVMIDWGDCHYRKLHPQLNTQIVVFGPHLGHLQVLIQGGRRFETPPHYELLVTKSRPIFQLKIAVS